MSTQKLLSQWLTLALIALTIYSLSCISGVLIPTKQAQASTNFPETLITMNSLSSEPVDYQVKQIIERQANAWETGNSEKIIADFAENCLFVVPGSSFSSKQQIKEAAESYFAEFTDTKVTIKRIVLSGDEGAVEWTWSETNKKTGKQSQAEDAIIFELEKGKIKYWREYIDKQLSQS
jgi:uncharacterized protein (TIGR02246 family)